MRPSKTLAPGSMIAGIAFAFALGGCTPAGPTVRADGDPSANLSSYKTFGFYDRVSTDKNAYTTILSTRLKETTRSELEKRGYQYSQSNPQLMVNFATNIENRTDVQSGPGVGAGGFYGYRAGMYGAWAGYPQDIETVHYQEGTLSIDLVDASKQKLVWQGVAQGRISKKAVEDPSAAIDRVVADIFAKFPVPAPNATASK
jgi:Domain of unknown function (DUF4136)